MLRLSANRLICGYICLVIQHNVLWFCWFAMWLGIVQVNLWDSPLVLLLLTIVFLNANEATRSRSSSIQAIYTGLYLWNYFSFFLEFFILVWGILIWGRMVGEYMEPILLSDLKEWDINSIHAQKHTNPFHWLLEDLSLGSIFCKQKCNPGHI